MSGTFVKVSALRLCAKPLRLISGEKGTTLVELMMAAGAMAFLFVGVGASIRLLQDSYKSIEAQQSEVLSSAIFGGSYIQVAEASTPSAAYLHAPVSKLCATATTPCLRKLVNGELQDATGTSLANLPANIQFYRDDSGDINSNLEVLKGAANEAPAKYSFSESLPTIKNIVGEQIYATWPLWDETSPGLLSMVRSSSVVYKVPYFTALSEVPTSSLSRTLLTPISGATSDTSTAQLVGKLMVFSNSDNRKYYTVVKIKAAQWCTTAMSACKASDIVLPANAASVGVNDVLITFEVVDTSTLPTAGAYPAALWQNGIAASSSPLFPTQSINVTDSTMSYLDPGNFHPRKILHYFHSQRITGEMIGIPVTLVSYSLEKKSATTYNLKRNIYNFGSTVTQGSNIIAGDLTAPVVMGRQLGTLELSMFMTQPVDKDDTPVDMAKYRVKSSLRAHMSPLTISALSRDPNPIQYPRTCEMTFSFQQFCGDGDVDNYYNTGWGKTQGEEYAGSDSSYHLVLGYFTEEAAAAVSDQSPEPEEWYAIGWQERNAGSTDVGLRMINSNVVRSGNDMLKEEIDMLAGLARYMPTDYEIYADAMICKDFQTADAVPDSGPLPAEVDDSLDPDVAGYAVTERAWKTGVVNIAANDTYTAGAIAGACDLPSAAPVPIGPGGFGTTPGGSLPYVYMGIPPSTLGPGCTAAPVESYGTVGGVYGIILTYVVTCTVTTTPPPATAPTVYSCATALTTYAPKCLGSVTCVDGYPGTTTCDPYGGCFTTPDTNATITESCSNGDKYINGVLTAPPDCLATKFGYCSLPQTPHAASAAGVCDATTTGTCAGSCSLGTWTTTSNTCAPLPPPACVSDLAAYTSQCGGTTTCVFVASYTTSIAYSTITVPDTTTVQEGCPAGTFYRSKRSGTAAPVLSGPFAAPTPAYPFDPNTP